MPMTAKRLKSIPKVEFQYGGRLFLETEVVISRPWSGLRYLVEIWYADSARPS